MLAGIVPLVVGVQRRCYFVAKQSPPNLWERESVTKRFPMAVTSGLKIPVWPCSWRFGVGFRLVRLHIRCFLSRRKSSVLSRSRC